jgi:serine/threonine protein kinase
MIEDLAAESTEELTFRHYADGPVTESVTLIGSTDRRAGDVLIARKVRLADGTLLSQVRAAAGSLRSTGYERLDNEILAGRRLHNVTNSSDYPAAVSFLYGDEAESADPYALLRPYHGKPLSEVVGQMLEEELRAFELSLLKGLCWLAAAGIAHRGLSPSTVRWDRHEKQAQITDFSLCTVFGAPRNPMRLLTEAARKQLSDGKARGLVTSRDDMYAAGLLIYYMRSQGDTSQPSTGKLTEMGLTKLASLFGPPEGRLTASELLRSYLDEANPVPRRAGHSARLADGAASFEFWWAKKNPGRSFPADPCDDRVPVRPPSPAARYSPAPPPPEPDRPGQTDHGRRRPWRRDDDT